jgi:addiction module RelE/StbE family toxin
MLVRWTLPAVDDLKDITRYIRKNNPASARHVAKTIFDAGNALNRFPQRGREGRIAGTRELVFPGWPYILVYEVRKQAVDILRVYHGAQDWP